MLDEALIAVWGKLTMNGALPGGGAATTNVCPGVGPASGETSEGRVSRVWGGGTTFFVGTAFLVLSGMDEADVAGAGWAFFSPAGEDEETSWAGFRLSGLASFGSCWVDDGGGPDDGLAPESSGVDEGI
jgi:hypothetical protein